MASVMSADMQNTDKVVIFIEDCRAMGLPPALPDVCSGDYMFTVNIDGEIVYGLGAIKGVGEGPIEAIVKARNDGAGEFKDFFDFCKRVGAKKLNKRVLEALVRSGALDKLGADRAVLWAAIGDALRSADQSERNQSSGIFDLFGEVELEQPRDPYEDYQSVRRWSDKERLKGEKETLGLYLTGHPIDEYEKELSRFVSKKIVDLQPARGRQQKIAGLIVDQRVKKTKRGDSLCFLTLDDRSARIDITVYGELYEQTREWAVKDTIVIMEGEVIQDDYSGGLKVRCNKLSSIPDARIQYAQAVKVKTDNKMLTGRNLKQFEEVLHTFKFQEGLPVTVEYYRNDACGTVKLGDSCRVNPSDELILALKDHFGDESIILEY